MFVKMVCNMLYDITLSLNNHLATHPKFQLKGGALIGRRVLNGEKRLLRNDSIIV